MTERRERLHSQGHIEVICGGMFSGKSEELLRRLRRAEIARRKTQAFKPSLDKRRGKDTINTYDGREWPAISILSASDLLELVEEDTDVVAIDEAQFLDDDLWQVCQKLALAGKRVIVAGLDMDFRGEPFGPIPNVLAVAEQIDKLHAICVKCGDEASVPQRMLKFPDGRVVPAPYDSELIVVAGGEEEGRQKSGVTEFYEARCRHCHEVLGGPE